MANAGASIEAVLTLNSTGFQQGITKSITALDKFVTSISKLKNTDGRLAIQNLTTALLEFDTVLRQVELMSKSSINTFSKLSSAVNKMANGLKLLQSDELNLVEAVNTMNNVFKAFQGVLEGTEVKVKELKIANDTLVASERQVASASAQESASVEKDSASKDKATASTTKYANANKTLSSSLSMVRNGLTLVGSMIAYNFIHNLAMATTETIKAKSEMQGYFQMLGYSTSQVDDFNKALDETVKKFPRLNKYALGETISSIGVEFELTTAEMKEAMPVVSMITSEYLRAGRNVNEASLAVKDILQGEFQRLSRETGVKGEQLKATGLWSGDKSDVMGLLKALEKVGQDRNWDIFVTKANSLNDAVLIMQNRFSEFSADMVGKFQPMIVNAFNQIMSVASAIAPIFTGALDWLSGDGLEQSIVLWSSLGLTITGVTTALIHSRTGASLLQIAQMGLKDSIIATVLGLNAEVVANEGLYTTIAMSITGLEAQELAHIGNTTAIFSNIVGLEMETVANESLWVALVQATTGLELEELALMTNAEALAIVGLEATALITTIGLLAVAFGGLVIQVMENTEKMKKFHKLANDGEKTLTDYDDAVNSLKTRQNELVETQKRYIKGSKEWLNVGTAIADLENDIALAQANRKNVEEAISIAEKSQQEWRDGQYEMQLTYERMINQSIVDIGVSTETANAITNKYLREANDGAELLKKAMDGIKDSYNSSAKGIAQTTKYMEKMGYSTDEIIKKVENLEKYEDFVIQGRIQMAESENIVDYFIGGATATYGELGKWWEQILPRMEQGDWENVLKPTFKGLVYGIGSLLGKTPDEVREVVKSNGDWWGMFFKTVPPFSTINNLGQMIKDYIHSRIGDIGSIPSIISDALFNSGSGSVSGTPAKKIDASSLFENIFSIDYQGIYNWVMEHIVTPLVESVRQGIEDTPVLGDIAKLLGFGEDTVNNFKQNAQEITSTATSTALNVSNSFTTMKNNHKSSMDSINSNNSKAFNDINTKTNTSLISMRDSTSNITHQMIGAWATMRDGILNSAKQIKDGSTSHFNALAGNIASFYRNIRNPANWSAYNSASSVARSIGSAGVRTTSRSPRPSSARRLFSGAGVNPYTQPNRRMGIKDLVNMIGVNERVDVGQFLALFSGGFGGWNFANTHNSYIRSKAHEWMVAPAIINGIGSVGGEYKVGRFNGRPSFTFDEFLATAQSVFSAIPYKFYYDSEWKGNWVNALMSGATNCSDGSDALLALASLFGYSGQKVHTTLADGTGHFYTMINGRALDTTNFQLHGSWSPLGGAGRPSRSHSTHTTKETSFNITINGDVYGMDDFESKMREASRRVMREEFNDPYTIAL